MDNTEQKKKRILTVIKTLGALAIGFVVAPFIWIAIGGLVGLIVATGISFVAWKFTGWFAMSVANWRLKAIKAEAARNPVETLQNDYAERMTALSNFRQAIGVFKGEIESFKGKLEEFSKQYPDERPRFEEQYDKMKQLYSLRVRNYEQAKQSLADYDLEIQKANAIWGMAQAAAKMTKSAGINEDDFMARIKVETALDSVQKSLHTSFAELELSLLDEKPLAEPKQSKALPASVNSYSDQIKTKPPMKTTIAITLAAMLCIVQATAQTNKSFVKGTIDIKYDTRLDAAKDGVKDTYTLNLNVSDSALFRGTVTSLPYKGGMTAFSTQGGRLEFNVDTHVVNPANPAQTRSVGKMVGSAPVDSNNRIMFAEGNAKITVNAVGTAQAFESKFDGIAIGKPTKGPGFIERMKKQAVVITKQVQGKTYSVTVTNYDKMTFVKHVVPSGPIQTYSEATATGDMIYDYERSAWHFDNLQISYVVDGRQNVDRITGSIIWVESAQRKSNGEGEYQFDVRVNETLSEASAFAKPSDEASFFSSDDSISGLVGSIKYKDIMRGGTVLASSAAVDLRGNKLTKQQTLNLAKLLLISAIVPLNAE